MTESIDRRRFLRSVGKGAAAVAVAPSLQGLVLRMLRAPVGTPAGASPRRGPDYGPLRPAGPELALPEGFRYKKLGVQGSIMSDGLPTPRAHDGMAAFPGPGDALRLMRNHEDSEPAATSALVGKPDTAWDRKGGGGVTALDVAIGKDGEPVLLRDFLVLNGTIVNCAGGPTPWGSWLSCEETTQGPTHGWSKPHGFVFEVPADAERPVEAQPLRAMGRLVHEAVAVDPSTGIVYMTEDRATAGLYRFIPKARGKLAAGGRLQMLAVDGRPGLNTHKGQTPGEALPVRWVDIRDPDPPSAETHDLAVFDQGRDKGAAAFARLEGCWFGDDSVYFHATIGGDAECGQVWQYVPPPRGAAADAGGTLRLVFESPSPEVLDGPDNVTVSPRGSVVICEDGHTDGNYVRGLTREGDVFDVARNILNEREFAGVTFSPDGRVLFVNIQGDRRNGDPGNLGMTLAIWGPWGDGAL